MRNSLYYGEMVARISAHLHQNPDHTLRISHVIQKHNDTDDTLWSVCADAAKVFDTLEDLSGEMFIDWYKALDRYACEILDHLLSGHKPHIVDFLSMAVSSIQSAR